MKEFSLMFSKKYKTGNWSSAEWAYLKKQTQFSKRSNERKVTFEKELWSFIAIGHLVKTKPIYFVLSTP